MVLEEYKIGNATVKIHDDYITSREESLEILKRVENIIMINLIAQANRGNRHNKGTS